MEGKMVLGIVRVSEVINGIEAFGIELNWCEKLEWHNTLSAVEQYMSLLLVELIKFAIDSFYHKLDNKYLILGCKN